MKIDKISIEKSSVAVGERVLVIECGGKTYMGYFDEDLNNFARSAVDGLKFFAQHAGLISVDPKTGHVTTLVKR